MTDRDTTPAERIQAYLEWEDDSEDAFIAAIHDDDGNRRSLQVADVRAVLAEHQAMRDELAGLRTEWSIGHGTPGDIWTGVTTYTEAGARHHAPLNNGFPVRRLVGEWQPTDDTSSNEGE